MPLTLAESIIYSTVRITTSKNGAPLSTGTGFFWNTSSGQEEPAGYALSLVTNKHVVEGADKVTVTCHVASTDAEPKPTGAFVNLNIELDPVGIIPHPNPETDLIAMSINGMVQQAHDSGYPLFIKAFNEGDVPSDETWKEFDAIEEVLMIGCPRGIMDEFNSHPIVRRGITASQLGKDYNGKPEFMVDMACFPGSSGSPVVMAQTNYTDRNNNLIMGRRFHFLGVLYQGPLVTNQGTITFGNTPSVQVSAMMHLGNVVRSTEIRWFDEEIRRRLPKP